MDNTANLTLPYIMAAQAQKHVTHNEAIRTLDALVQLAVLDRDLATPPAAPAEGARYIVAAGPTGAWAGQAGRIAAWQDSAWTFYTPREGWVSWVADDDTLYAWDGVAWVVAGGSSTNPTPLVGVNATADATNRLSVNAPATLLNHEGAGHQLKVNKAAAANTASLLFQTAFSGRAEMGLTGDDDFHVEVSADGAIFKEAIVVNRATGAVTFPFTSFGGGGGYSTYVINRTQPNLKFWTTKLNRLLRFNERPRINLYGDSTTLGSGGVVQKFSPGELLAQALSRRGIPAQANMFGNPFPSTAAYTAFEPRLTFTGTWGGWTAAHGTSTYRCSSNAGTVTFAPGFAHDTIDLYWHRGGSFGAEGSMTLTVDGGATQFSTPTSGGNVSSQTISQAGATGHQKTTITVAAAGVHTITVTNGATNHIELYGFEAFTAAKGEVLIRCLGAPSHTSTMLVAAPLRTSAWAVPGELCVLSVGINDWAAAIPTATFAANLALLNEDFRVNSISDILYWTPPPSSFASYSQALQQTYVDAMKAAANTTVVVGDLWQRWDDRGGYAANTGYYNDALHPSAFGDRDIAGFLADTIMGEGQ